MIQFIKIKLKEKSDNIIENLKEFFNSGNTLDIDFRIHQLKILKSALIEYEEKIYKAFYLDLHKSREETFLTELFVVFKEIKFFLKNLKKLSKPKRVRIGLENQTGKSYIYPEPYGVALIISPWNYPVNLSLVPLIGAIAAGNCVVLKPSEYSENVSLILKEMISKYFPENFTKVVTGDAEVSKKLLENDFDYIFFTGSQNVGKHVMKKASEKLIPVTLELGGKNPTIVDSNCDLKLAAKRIAWGKTLNAGQTCISPDYLLIDHKIKEKFLPLLKTYLKEYSNNMAHIINEKHIERLSNLLDNTEGKILFGGKFNGKKLEPTIVDNVFIDDVLMKDEIFGPILPIITFNEKNEIFEIISKNPYPLSLYVFSNDKLFIKKIISRIQAGGITINDTITHFVPETLPFGGIKSSGIGSYHGKYSFDTFSHYKPVFIKGKFELNVKYPPYKGIGKIKKLLMRRYT